MGDCRLPVLLRDLPLVRAVLETGADGGRVYGPKRLERRPQLGEGELGRQVGGQLVARREAADGLGSPVEVPERLAHVDQAEALGRFRLLLSISDFKSLEVLIVALLIADHQPCEEHGCEGQLRVIRNFVVVAGRNEVLSLHPRHAEMEAGLSANAPVLWRYHLVGHIDDPAARDRGADELPEP